MGTALELLELDRRGRRLVRAYVAGGSQMYTGEAQRKTVGPQNQEILERTLAENRITVVGSDFGGELGRQIVVDGKRGIVFTMQLGGDTAPDEDQEAPGVQWNLPASFRPISGWTEGTGTGSES